MEAPVGDPGTGRVERDVAARESPEAGEEVLRVLGAEDADLVPGLG